MATNKSYTKYMVVNGVRTSTCTVQPFSVLTNFTQLAWGSSGATYPGGRKALESAATSLGYKPINSYVMTKRELLSHTLGEFKVVRGLPYTGSSAGTYITTDTLSIDVDWMAQNLAWGSAYSSERSRTIAGANSKVRNQLTGLGETFGEARKSISMIANAAKAIANGYKCIRKAVLNPLDASRHLSQAANALRSPLDGPTLRKMLRTMSAHQTKMALIERNRQLRRNAKDRMRDEQVALTVANLWLQFRYGWMPLLYTADGALRAIDSGLRGHNLVYRVVKNSDVVNWSTFTIGQTRGDGYSMNPGSRYGASTAPLEHYYRNLITDEFTNRVQIGYYFRVDNDHLGLNTQNQLGLDPVTTTWELIPFSFVVDWFVNVGDVLEQLTAFRGVKFLEGWETTTRTCTRSVEHQFLGTNFLSGHTRTLTRASKSKSLLTEVVRTRLTTPPSVSLTLNVRLNTLRVSDGIALLQQQLSRR